MVHKQAGNMEVTLEFEIKNVLYKIERGRLPDFLKFYINDKIQTADEQLGEKKETQKEIDKI